MGKIISLDNIDYDRPVWSSQILVFCNDDIADIKTDLIAVRTKRQIYFIFPTTRVNTLERKSSALQYIIYIYIYITNELINDATSIQLHYSLKLL